MKIKPLGDNVLIKPTKPKDTTEGGLALPDQAKNKLYYGVVVEIGPGRMLDNGLRNHIIVRAGDIVYWQQYAGNEVELGGETLLVVPDEKLLLQVELED